MVSQPRASTPSPAGLRGLPRRDRRRDDRHPTVTLTNLAAISGAPSITLSADTHTYRVTLTAAYLQSSTQFPVAVGIGTAANAILKYTYCAFSAELETPCFVQVDIVGNGTGQTISRYAFGNSASGTVTLVAASNTPAELSAVLVAA